MKKVIFLFALAFLFVPASSYATFTPVAGTPWIVGANTVACTESAAGGPVHGTRYCCPSAITEVGQLESAHCLIAAHTEDTCGGNFAVEVNTCTLTPAQTTTPPPAAQQGTTGTGQPASTGQNQPTSGIATFKPIVPIPGLTGPGDSPNFAQYVNRIFSLMIQLGAILAVLMIVYGGFEYMTSAAGITKKDGSEKIQGAVTGLILLLASYLILFVINPCLVKIDLFTPDSGCSVSVQGDALRSQTPIDTAIEGTYNSPDGSCVALRPTTCTSGSAAVHKCTNNQDPTVFTEPTGGTCGEGTSDAYVCEASPCGDAPQDAPDGATFFTGDQYTCIKDGIHCPQNFNVQTACPSPPKTLSEVCLFPENKIADGNRCPETSQRAYMCSTLSQ